MIEENSNLEIFIVTFSSEEKEKLRIESNVSKILSNAQKFNLMWWEILKPKKTYEFYRQLNIGTMVKYAYEIAECY
ncbi:hypothetical protein PL373_02620 [Tenacibaculum maritimum]|nr:hypothetical protein [Tenacibaculum maritimum]MDB0600066.1 hypothetical protein [Tenacibaculum maritimum]MDB0611179.1 hypothetical protein [Tenacibaculum maritimum]